MTTGIITTRAAVFAALKPMVSWRGSYSQPQVDGIDTLIDAWNAAVTGGATVGLQQAEAFSYILVGVKTESAKRMFPVREGVYVKPWGHESEWTDALARVFIAQHGYKYAKLVNGVMYYGRGRIQNTWDFNLKKLALRFNRPELFPDPDLLITDIKLDATITVFGHIEGIWTGARLSRYFAAGHTADPVHARQMVNGLDHAGLIADDYERILPGVRAAMQA